MAALWIVVRQRRAVCCDVVSFFGGTGVEVGEGSASQKKGAARGGKGGQNLRNLTDQFNDFIYSYSAQQRLDFSFFPGQSCPIARKIASCLVKS